MVNLVQIYIGKNLPTYIYDNIYQTLLMNNYDTFRLYVLIDSECVDMFKKSVSKLNINTDSVKCISLNSTCENIEKYKEYTKKFKVDRFRDNFWLSTTMRFFYMEEFMSIYNISNMFHIENDVMLYEDLRLLGQSKDLWMVQDSVDRVIPSIMYIPNITSLMSLNNHILNETKNSDTFLNDMALLGSYKNKKHFPIDFDSDSEFIYDGAAIGQYLGGVDPRNLAVSDNEELKMVRNPSKGFINETSDFKINKDMTFFRKSMFIDFIDESKNLDLMYGVYKGIIKRVVNIHVHSKQLCQFSSVFDIKYDDIITGDRVLSLCDVVFTTDNILSYHKGVVIKNKIVMNENLNIEDVNEMLLGIKKPVVKIFVYTHILGIFEKYILSRISPHVKLVLYLHNSDHKLESIIENKNVVRVYSQNPSITHPSVRLLPIGVANSMFRHGNLLELYNVMSNEYKNRKTKDVYININPATYNYRQVVIDEFQKGGVIMSKSGIPFKEYLEELSKHNFCLCVRGNGYDTHRFWESLYVKTVPVIINNRFTDMQGFVDNLKKLGVPFYEIKEESLDIIVEKYFKYEFFNDDLYNTFSFSDSYLLHIDYYNYI